MPKKKRKKKKKRKPRSPKPSPLPIEPRGTPEPKPEKDKGGRPAWRVTRKVIEKAGHFAELGLRRDDIAHNLGVAPSTLYAYLKELPELLEAIEGGKAMARMEIKGILYEEARKKRMPWAIQTWLRHHDPAPTHLIHSGDPEAPIVVQGTKHEPFTGDESGDALAILEAAVQRKRKNKKGGKSKSK